MAAAERAALSSDAVRGARSLPVRGDACVESLTVHMRCGARAVRAVHVRCVRDERACGAAALDDGGGRGTAAAAIDAALHEEVLLRAVQLATAPVVCGKPARVGLQATGGGLQPLWCYSPLRWWVVVDP